MATTAQITDDGPPLLAAADTARIAAALRHRHRAVIDEWYQRLSTTDTAPADRKWLARLAFAAGEFERAWDVFCTLKAEGALELADACLLLKASGTLHRPVSAASVLAQDDLDAAYDLDPHAQTALLYAANQAYDTGDRAFAARLFDTLVRLGYDKPHMDKVRHGKSLIAARQFARALDLLMRIDAREPLSEDNLCALADAALSAGRRDIAGATFDRLKAVGHVSVYFVERYMDYMRKEDRRDEAVDLLERIGDGLSEGMRQRLIAIMALESDDLDAAIAAFADLDAEVAASLGDRVAGFAYRLLPTANEAVIAKLAPFVERVDSDRPGIVQFAIDLAFRRQDYNAAAEAIDHARRHLPAARQPLLLLKEAELEAFRGNIHAALEAVAAIGVLHRLPSEYLSPIATVFAEAHAWPQILTLVRTRLEDWFSYRSHAAAVLSAAAAEDAWEELIEAIEASLVRADNDDVRKLRVVTMERIAGSDRIETLLEDDDARRIDAYQIRLIARAEALGTDTAVPTATAAIRSAYERDTAIFYCTDTGYLAPAFNSIHSLLLSNGTFLDDTAIHLYVEPDDVEISEAIAEQLRGRYGCSLTVTPSTTLLERFEGSLRTDYGLFTGGMQLSQSAYYRIFALRHLLDTDAKRRALYIDSDTLVIGEISRIFSALDGSKPMAVRREIDKFEVRRVEELHGLPPGTYFNSGVLAVDMEHPDLRFNIDRTLREVSDHADKLVYHDQCALNRGFEGFTANLPPEFNSFCTVRDSLTSAGAAGVVLHFLDRPKPWQPGYEGSLSAFWYRYWRELAKVVDRATLTRLTQKSSV